MSVMRQYKACFTNFEAITCSDFWGDSDIWILSVHFIYLFCICWVCMPSQNWAYLPLWVPFKNRVTKTQPCIKWGPLGRTTLYLIRNLLLGIMLLGLNKKTTFEVRLKKRIPFRQDCCLSFPKSLQSDQFIIWWKGACWPPENVLSAARKGSETHQN